MMAQTPGTTGPRRSQAQGGNDIYTVLASIALATVLGTIGFVIYRCVQLFDTPFPGFTG
jgi:hypothetical protein